MLRAHQNDVHDVKGDRSQVIILDNDYISFLLRTIPRN